MERLLTNIVLDWCRSFPRADRSIVLGLSGPQGSGKSTLARALSNTFGDKIAILGIDDFYLTRGERRRLSNEVSTLFETRGPPGTHDLDLLNETIDSLMLAGATEKTVLPVFDKTSDDRVALNGWGAHEGRPEIILVEGWLVGADAPDDFAAAPPMNDVERADLDGRWRRHQALLLQSEYAALWDRMAGFFHIDGPGFETVAHWRTEQEETSLGLTPGTLPRPRREWVFQFVQYYERLTRAMADGCRRPGACAQLDVSRACIGVDGL